MKKKVGRPGRMGQITKCKVCGNDIIYTFARTGIPGWVHHQPLKEMKVSTEEAQAIYSDPPRPHEILHRTSFLHEAEPV